MSEFTIGTDALGARDAAHSAEQSCRGNPPADPLFKPKAIIRDLTDPEESSKWEQRPSCEPCRVVEEIPPDRPGIDRHPNLGRGNDHRGADSKNSLRWLRQGSAALILYSALAWLFLLSTGQRTWAGSVYLAAEVNVYDAQFGSSNWKVALRDGDFPVRRIPKASYGSAPGKAAVIVIPLLFAIYVWRSPAVGTVILLIAAIWMWSELPDNLPKAQHNPSRDKYGTEFKIFNTSNQNLKLVKNEFVQSGTSDNAGSAL